MADRQSAASVLMQLAFAIEQGENRTAANPRAYLDPPTRCFILKPADNPPEQWEDRISAGSAKFPNIPEFSLEGIPFNFWMHLLSLEEDMSSWKDLPDLKPTRGRQNSPGRAPEYINDQHQPWPP